MGILTAIWAQARYGLYGLIVAGLLIAGWQANQWRIDSSQLKAAKAAIQAEQKARLDADNERVTMGMKLSELEAELLTSSNQAKQIVRVYVTKDPRCDLEPAIVRVLRDARAGRLPSTAYDVAPAGGTSTATPGQ